MNDLHAQFVDVFKTHLHTTSLIASPMFYKMKLKQCSIFYKNVLTKAIKTRIFIPYEMPFKRDGMTLKTYQTK
jgi:hypothetical protein